MKLFYLIILLNSIYQWLDIFSIKITGVLYISYNDKLVLFEILPVKTPLWTISIPNRINYLAETLDILKCIMKVLDVP